MDSEIRPCCQKTQVGADAHEWRPASFPDLLKELQHLGSAAEGPRYRGQSNAVYSLDSTLARSIQEVLLRTPYWSADPYDRERFDALRDSLEMMWLAQGVVQLKFGGLMGIPQELSEAVSANPGIDPYFELMKGIQQYPEWDGWIKGSPLLDWSVNPHVGLYFSATNHDGSVPVDRDGALWICDARAMGKIEHQDPATLSVEAALDDIRERVKGCDPGSTEIPALPMIFNPKVSVSDPRVERQEAVYFMQVDLRHDLAAIWRQHEAKVQKRLYIKLVVPRGSQAECIAWLRRKGYTLESLFP